MKNLLVWLEVSDEGGFCVAEGDDYGFGVALGTLGAGVGVVDGEEERGLLGAEGFEAVGFDGGHVYEGDLLGCGELGVEVAEAHVAFDLELAVRVGDQMLRIVMVRRMGVALFARVSAMYLRMYQP